MSNIQRKKISLNVRRDGHQPSIFVRSLGAITRELPETAFENERLQL
jgi:hypothetical protein